MQWFKRQKNKVWTVISSAFDYACIVQVSQPPSAKPVVHATELKPCDLLKLDNLQTLVKNHNLKNTNCSYVLDLNYYQFIQVDAPNVDAAERKETVRWMLKDMVDYPMEQATIDLMEIPKDPANPDKQAYLYAAVAKNTHISQICNNFVDANIKLKAMDIAVAAQRNIAKYLEQPNRALAMLSFGQRIWLLTFTAGGEIYHVRRIEVDSELNANAFERIALEVQRSLDQFEWQFPFISVNRLVVAPFNERDDFMLHLKAALYIPIESFHLSDIFDFDQSVRLGGLTEQARLLTALGGALREEMPA